MAGRGVAGRGLAGRCVAAAINYSDLQSSVAI